MARETEIDLRINSNIDKVNKDIQNTTESIEELGKASAEVGNSWEDFSKKAEDSLGKAEKGVDKVTGAVKGIEGVGKEVGQNLAVIEEGFAMVGVESEALAGTIEGVDQAMAFTEGVQGLAEAGQGFLNFGKMGLKALNVVKGALISTGIGAIVVGIGVAIGLIITYWDDIVDAFTGEGTSGISKAIKFAFAPIFLTIEAVKLLIEGVKMLWSIITTGSTEAYHEEKKRQAQLEETKKKNEELIEVTKKQQRETQKQIKAEEKLAKRRKQASEQHIADLERELALKQAQQGTTAETIKLEENLAKERAEALTQELEDSRKVFEQKKKARDEAKTILEAERELAKAAEEEYGTFSDESIEAWKEVIKVREKLEEAQKVVNDALAEGTKLAQEQKQAVTDSQIAEVEAQRERADLYKDARDKRIAFERELFDEQLNSVKEGIEKERIILTESYRRQREDIMNNEDLTAKQKKELIEANKKAQDFAVEELEKNHQEALTEIDAQAEDIRISMIKDDFIRQKEEINKGYEDQLAEIEKNEIMTEEQKTKLRLLYAEQRDDQLRAIELEDAQKRLENRIALAQAEEIEAQKDFESAMEFRKQQLDLQLELDLSQAELSAEQKLLIEAEYQQAVRDLEEETVQYKKEKNQEELDSLNEKLDIAMQGLDLITEATEFATELQSRAIDKRYAREIEDAEGNEALIKEIEKRKLEEQNKIEKRAFAIKKASDLAKATISGFQAVLTAFASAPPPLNFINAGLAGAFSALTIGKIASTQFEGATFDESVGSGGSGAGAGAGGDVISPEFNIVGDSGINQLEGLDQPPIEAYVVSGNVTSAQSLDRNRIENATI